MKKRIEFFRNLLEKAGFEAMVVNSGENRRYLSGFSGSSGYLLITPGHNYLVTDFRYISQATDEALDFQVVRHGREPWALAAEFLKNEGVKQLAFEAENITYNVYEELREAFTPLELVPTRGLVAQLREVKDEGELKLIHEAARLADAAFTHICGFLHPGLTEADAALEIEFFMRRQGAGGVSFPTIVASGPRGALPHGVAGDRPLASGDLVVMDFGAVFQGYCSDLTRTVAIGAPDERQQDVYGVVKKAQQAALDKLRPGLTGEEIDGVARDIIKDAGYGENFGHSLGHGVGMAVHEEPSLGPGKNKPLHVGAVVTVEPGIYIDGWGGVRIEDLVVVTAEGCEVLSHAPKNLIVL